MQKGRLEAFSDGVIAILITIMVLELKVPHGHELADLQPLLPVLASYVMSFVFLGIYWNNHHHMLHAVRTIPASALWANLHLLFWLSLVPFVTGWMAESDFTQTSVALYGAVLLGCGFAYYWLSCLLVCEDEGSVLARAVGRDRKGKMSMAIYLVGIALSFLHPALAIVAYLLVSIMWFIPDHRIEVVLEKDKRQ